MINRGALGRIIPFRKSIRRTERRKRGLLESPWLIPGIVAMAAAGYFGGDVASSGIGVLSGSAPKVTFRECYTALDGTCVVDSDTIRLQGVKIRLEDIDAPEVRDFKCASEKALGDRATRRLVEVLNSGKIAAVKVGSRDEDRSGRKLRVVQVDGRSAGAILVSEGLARKWSGKRRPWCL